MTNANLLICCLKALPDEPDIKVMQSMEFKIRNQKVQWLQFLLQQSPVYEAKVPISDEHSTI